MVLTENLNESMLVLAGKVPLVNLCVFTVEIDIKLMPTYLVFVI